MVTIKEYELNSKIPNEVVDAIVRLDRKLDNAHIEFFKDFPYKHLHRTKPIDVDAPISVEDRKFVRRANSGLIYHLDTETNQVVSYLQYTKNKSITTINSLYVEDTYRHRHLGHELMDRCYNTCKKLSVSKINLGCVSTNKIGIEFYMKEGYWISDTAYILTPHTGKPIDTFTITDREYSKEDFHQIWMNMYTYMNKNINKIDEITELERYYSTNTKIKPYKTLIIDGYNYASYLYSEKKILYIFASDLDTQVIRPDYMDTLAISLLDYAHKIGCEFVGVNDYHLPTKMGSSTKCWYEESHTFYKLV